MSRHFIDTPTVAGQVGSFLTYCSRVLCVGEVLRDAAGFTDHSTEARIEGGTVFNLLAATTDFVYVGYDAKFPGVRVDIATAGVNVTLAAEYWDGSWVSLSITDGTTNLTVDGQITWMIPAAWVKNSVNAGPSMFHVRFKTTTTPSTTPTANFVVVNWTIFDDAAGTNAKVYKSIGEDGVSNILLWISDNGTEYTDAKMCAARIYESWDAALHTGTAPTPTVAQVAAGIGLPKSSTADATARTVKSEVTRDGILVCFYNAWVANRAWAEWLGGLQSYQASDAYRGCVIGEQVAATAAANPRLMEGFDLGNNAPGHYVQRTYTAAGASIAVAKPRPYGFVAVSGFIPNPNGPDSGVHSYPLVIHEGTTSRNVRGTIPHVLFLPHQDGATIVDAETITLAGITYTIVRLSDANNSVASGAFIALRSD